MRSKTVRTLIAIAIMLAMAVIPFMASVTNSLRDAGVAVAGILVIVALSDALGGSK